MTRKENIRAILECYFTGFKDVMIDSACERICELEQEPTAEKSVLDMTELEKALLHIKTRADAWAVKVVKDALLLMQEPCETIHGSTYGGVSWGGTYKLQEPCTDAVSREAVENITWEEPSYTDALNVLTEVRDKVRALPSVNPQPCDDAISQNQSNACSILDDECPYPHKHCWECPLNYQYELAKHELDKNVDLPSVTQKSGKWIKKEDDTCWWYVCSECEQEPLKNRWNDDDVLSTFCPNCGAKMVEPQESEEQTDETDN